MERNVGSTDRLVRLGLGAVLLVVAIVVGLGVVGVGSGTVATVGAPLVLGVVGLVLLVTGYTRTCPAYSLLGIRTLRRGN
ncbi:YgaP family membrane protein [Haloarchaeobius baliensis]|uniref:YgaP family membrane protein n=1 Tax=Haloarchaeobius baliensis TaxID=1670458 RepID=UPI003F885B60